MEDNKNKLCRFCFQLISDSISPVSVDNVRNMVKSLLPDDDISENLVICNSCLIHLQSAYNFMRTANENNLKILDATIENDDDLCQTCLKPVENTNVYLYNRLDNVAPLPLIKRMLECSLIFLNLEYRRYPVMCDDCWEILRKSYSFLMCCVQDERQLYKEHNYTLVGLHNITKLKDTMPNQKNINYVKHISEENIFSDLKTEINEPVIIKQEIKEEIAITAELEKSSDAIEVKPEKNENAAPNNVFMVEEIEFEDNLDGLKVEDSDIKLFEELNTTREKITTDLNMKENDIIKIGEDSSVKMGWSDGLKKRLYIKLERLDLTHKKSLMERTNKCTQVYKCHLCSYSSKKKYKHTRHSATHMTLEDCAKNNNLYKCNNCNYITKLKYSLRRHIKQVHRCIYICQKCDYETNETETFTLHVKSQHNNNLIAYNCELCSYSCFTKLQLKQHVKTHDLDKIILKCSQCAFETKQILTLDKHLMGHKNMRISKLYKCEICAYQVKKKSSISRHVLTHSTKKELFNSNILYQCHECGYKAKRKDSLVVHIRIRHKKNKEKKKETSTSRVMKKRN